jgi:hypothetical protein
MRPEGRNSRKAVGILEVRVSFYTMKTRIDLTRISRLVKNVNTGKTDHVQVVLCILVIVLSTILISCGLAQAF